MGNKVSKLVNESFERKEGSSLPTHNYRLSTLPAKKVGNGSMPSPSPMSSWPSTPERRRARRRQSPPSTSVNICLLRVLPVGRRGSQPPLPPQRPQHQSVAVYYFSYLGSNGITAAGCSSLFPGQWSRNLRSLDLGNNHVIKARTTSLTRAAWPCPRESSPSWGS